ncbi:CD82 antigen-like isoform X2 [Babylonia areolata]|uniref:CD82 antigen-like isoform X2 n=1 Tax=Babylonia areolata TaxID=304850 RepID=UPI003FD362BB
MAEGKCAQCARYFLIIFNFIFWLSGGVIMGVGIYLLMSDQVETSLSNLIDMAIPIEFVYTAACVMIGVGSFVFFVGFCGCCGAMRESAIMLGIYIACMVLVFLGEVTAGIYVAVEKGGIETQIRGDLAYTVRNYTGSGNATIDFLQVKFHCCGSDNYTDYQQSLWFLNQEEIDKHFVPKTCCLGEGKDAASFHPHNYPACNQEAQAEAQAWDTFNDLQPKGCYNSLLEWLDDQSFTLIGVVVGIGVIEIFGVLFAVCLCRNRSEYYD